MDTAEHLGEPDRIGDRHDDDLAQDFVAPFGRVEQRA